MAGGARIVTRLLLLSFIRTGVNGDDCLICAKRNFNIALPCGETVCIHMWRFSTRVESGYMALISNGEIQTSGSPDDASKCTLPIQDITAEDVGRHVCQQKPGAFSTHTGALPLDLMPGKTLSLQCVLLDFLERRRCNKALQRNIRLTWVDGTDAEVQEDSEHRIKRQSACDVTLLYTPQSDPTERFRCRMTVGTHVQTSVEMRIGSQGRRGRRGRIMLDRDQKGGRQNVIGAGVGVVGCVALTTLLVAAAIVGRRRANRPPPEETINTVSANTPMNADDVIYSDIIFPAGSETAWVPEREPTEYASVRC
ncbi:unnamed protein product [Ophioblennius macclurei]